jgi:hypothetical protein
MLIYHSIINGFIIYTKFIFDINGEIVYLIYIYDDLVDDIKPEDIENGIDWRWIHHEIKIFSNSFDISIPQNMLTGKYIDKTGFFQTEIGDSIIKDIKKYQDFEDVDKEIVKDVIKVLEDVKNTYLKKSFLYKK